MDKALCITHSWAELLSVDLEISYLLPKYNGEVDIGYQF